MFHNRLLRLGFVAMTAVLLLIGARPASVARAAQLAQTDATEVVPGFYESDVLTAEDSSETQISLFLASDGTLMAMTDHLDGEPAVMEMGEWEDNGATVTVSITGDESGDYEEPVVIEFAVDGDTLTADDEDLFGDTPLVLTLVSTEDEFAGETTEDSAEMDKSAPVEIPGVYATMPMDTGDGPGVVVFNLAEDGSAEAIVSVFDGESLPLMRLGEWVDNGDDTVTVTMTQELTRSESSDIGVAVDLEEVEPITFAVSGDGTLVAEEFTAYSLSTLGVEADDDGESSDGSTEDADIEVFVSDVMPAADSAGRVVALSLAADGAAALATRNLDDESVVVEIGEWVDNEDGTITVSLSGTEDEEVVYDEPVIITFELTDDGLTATEYDEELYGEDGLVLTLQAEDDSSDAEGSESDTLVLETAEDAPILARMEAYEDGSVSMVIDFQEGDAPEGAIGTWENNEDGTITVALTGDGSVEFDTPVVLVFEIGGDDSVTAIEWDESIFGEEPLTLIPVEE